MNKEATDAGLDWAVAQGLVDVGVAQRVRIVTRMASCERVSGQDLARLLGVSRAAVHKHVQHLRDVGLRVESVAGSGYEMHSPWDLLTPETVVTCLLSAGRFPPKRTPVLGLPYAYHPALPSTNALLKSGALAGLSEGALLVTDDQTAGRGRLGRGWSSQPGKDLTFSYLLRPSIAPPQVHLVVLAASLGVADALLSFPALTGRVRIKWPNDVLIDGRKVCGILAESSMDMDRVHWVVVGVGLNVNGRPGPQLSAGGSRPEPIGVAEALDRHIDRVPLLIQLMSAISGSTARLLAGEMDQLIGAFSELDALRGARVVVRSCPPPQEVVAVGRAEGLGPAGELLVRGEDGRVRAVLAGEVTLEG